MFVNAVSIMSTSNARSGISLRSYFMGKKTTFCRHLTTIIKNHTVIAQLPDMSVFTMRNEIE